MGTRAVSTPLSGSGSPDRSFPTVARPPVFFGRATPPGWRTEPIALGTTNDSVPVQDPYLGVCIPGTEETLIRNPDSM
jgi:hypothetical protein